jgi:hypothetical protein
MIACTKRVGQSPTMTKSLLLSLLCLSIKIAQKSPLSLFGPALSLPIIRRLGVEIYNVEQTLIMCNHREHILVRVELGQFFDAALRLLYIQVQCMLRGRREVRFRAAFAGMNCFEDLTGAERCLRCEWRLQRRGRDGVRERQVLRWPELASMMRDVTTEEHESWWLGRRASERTQVPDCMAWGVEQVEASIAIEVEGAEFSNTQAVAFAFEIDLAQVAVLPCAFVYGRLRDGGEAWHECRLEAWADDQVGRSASETR